MNKTENPPDEFVRAAMAALTSAGKPLPEHYPRFAAEVWALAQAVADARPVEVKAGA